VGLARRAEPLFVLLGLFDAIVVSVLSARPLRCAYGQSVVLFICFVFRCCACWLCVRPVCRSVVRQQHHHSVASKKARDRAGDAWGL